MILVPDVSKSALFSARETSVTVKSLLCLPIVSKSRAVGAMNLSHPRIEEVSENLKEVLQVLSSMVGQVVTIARLSSDLFRAKMVRSERLAGVGQLAASVVHEINNPLTNVMLRAQKIELDASASDGVKKTAEEIEEAGKKISRIVNRLLDYTRAREANREPMNVHAVLEESLAMTQSFVSSCGGIRIVREFSDPETFPQIVADTGCLEQVFTNLVINAALALKDRGRGTITIRTEALSDGVAIEFEDDGIGIPAENVEKIFQPFFTTRSESEGTGLGLFVCRDIVHDHDGTIAVRSRPGEGSTFRITLPFGSERADDD
jgi:two-component system NtrC family sensor kinase